jgi:hypothetical protein
MMNIDERYKRDPIFKNLVDLFGHYLEENSCRQFTPTELREAVMLAATMYEYRHIRPIVIDGRDPLRLSSMIPCYPWDYSSKNSGINIRIKSERPCGGRQGTRLAADMSILGIKWTPVLWEDSRDPDFIETKEVDEV